MDRRARQPEASAPHAFIHPRLHASALFRCRRALWTAYRFIPRHRRRHERPDIDRGAVIFELAEVPFGTIPIELKTKPSQPLDVGGPHRPERGTHRLADDLARDPLADMALAGAVGQERDARPATRIDESGRDCLFHGVDDLAGAAIGEVANGGDSIAPDGPLRPPPGVAAAAVDPPAPNDRIEFRGAG